jgi:hypothetical protein
LTAPSSENAGLNPYPAKIPPMKPYLASSVVMLRNVHCPKAVPPWMPKYHRPVESAFCARAGLKNDIKSKVESTILPPLLHFVMFYIQALFS